MSSIFGKRRQKYRIENFISCLGTLPSIKSLNSFDWLIKKLKTDNVIADATLIARCDVKNSVPTDSPGAELANYWRSNSKFYDKVRHETSYRVILLQ